LATAKSLKAATDAVSLAASRAVKVATGASVFNAAGDAIVGPAAQTAYFAYVTAGAHSCPLFSSN
jgi:hypothetical protein